MQIPSPLPKIPQKKMRKDQESDDEYQDTQKLQKGKGGGKRQKADSKEEGKSKEKGKLMLPPKRGESDEEQNPVSKGKRKGRKKKDEKVEVGKKMLVLPDKKPENGPALDHKKLIDQLEGVTIQTSEKKL